MKACNQKFSLKRTTQCKNCPWKVGTEPYEIPYGYSLEMHKALIATIANETDIIQQLQSDTLRVMACHHAEENEADYCVGYLYNQLFEGNNIKLRLSMRHCDNLNDLKIVGPQHKHFTDTIPSEDHHHLLPEANDRNEK